MAISIRKATRRFLLFMAVVLSASLCALAYIIFIWDVDPPDDSALLPAFAEVPDSENGTVPLLEAMRLAADWRAQVDLPFPANTAHEPWDGRDLIVQTVQGDNWVAAHVEEWLAANEFAFEKLDASVERPRFAYSQAQRSRFDTGAHGYALANLNAVRARAAAQEGRHGEAAATLLRAVEAGRRAQDAEVPARLYNALSTLIETNIETLIDLLPEIHLPSEELRGLAKLTWRLRKPSRAYAGTLKHDYHTLLQHLEHPYGNWHSAWRAPRGQDELERIVLRFTIKRNLSARWALPVYEEALANFQLESYSGKARRRERQEKLASYASGGYDNIGPLLDPNYGGKSFAASCIENLDTPREALFMLDFRIEALAALLALKAYTAEHGELPERLDQLVPQYLPSLPLDPFDGKPLRYDKQRKLLWSVGVNLREGVNQMDDGGPKAAFNDPNRPPEAVPYLSVDELLEPGYLIRFHIPLRTNPQ